MSRTAKMRPRFPDMRPRFPNMRPRFSGTGPHVPESRPRSFGMMSHVPESRPRSPGMMSHVPGSRPRSSGMMSHVVGLKSWVGNTRLRSGRSKARVASMRSCSGRMRSRIGGLRPRSGKTRRGTETISRKDAKTQRKRWEVNCVLPFLLQPASRQLLQRQTTPAVRTVLTTLGGFLRAATVNAPYYPRSTCPQYFVHQVWYIPIEPACQTEFWGSGNHSVMDDAGYMECGGNDAAFPPLSSRTFNFGKSGVVAAALQIVTLP